MYFCQCDGNSENFNLLYFFFIFFTKIPSRSGSWIAFVENYRFTKYLERWRVSMNLYWYTQSMQTVQSSTLAVFRGNRAALGIVIGVKEFWLLLESRDYAIFCVQQFYLSCFGIFCAIGTFCACLFWLLWSPSLYLSGFTRTPQECVHSARWSSVVFLLLYMQRLQ